MIATEKLALMIKDEFVVIIIGMIVRQLQGPGIALDRSRAESTDNQTVAKPGGVRRRRDVITGTHERPNVPPVQALHRQITVPANSIQRVEWVSRCRYGVLPLDADQGLLFPVLCLECLIDPGVIQNRRIKYRVLPYRSFVRQPERPAGGFDHENRRHPITLQTPHRGTRNQQVVAARKFQVTIVTVQVPRALVNKQHLITIRVAR